MKIYNIFNLVLISLCIFQSCQKIDGKTENNPSKPSPGEILSPGCVYEQNKGGYELYRIPAIVKSGSGVLLAFSEARKTRSTGDSGDIDLVLKRSIDGGKTWGEMIMVWDDGRNTCGNPVPIVGKDGIIHLLMTWNKGEDKWGSITSGQSVDTRRSYYSYSEDEGLSWSVPVEITTSVKSEDWDWYGTGPCHGIMMTTGKYAGRLISPNYFTKRENGKVVSYSHVIYSDDNGKSWQAGSPVPVSGVGECAVAELGDGTLLLDMRASEGFYRKLSRSTDGGLSWSEPVAVVDLVDSDCQGSILYDGKDLYQSNTASATERMNMTVKRSSDNGKTWKAQYIVYQGKSGYSDIVEISEKEIAVLYEGGISRYTESIVFKVVPKSSIR